MLKSVPKSVNTAVRQVVLRHPNSMPCVVFRKAVNRQDDPADMLGGAPTLGGMGVLDSIDEDDFDFDQLGGEARVLFTDGMQAGDLSMTDTDDSIVQPAQVMAQIEFVALSEPPLRLKKHDVIYALPGDGVHLPYEIVGIQSTQAIPPYTEKYILEARDELGFLADDIDPALPAP